MRKVLLTACALGIIASAFSAVASADEITWTAQFQGGSGTFSNQTALGGKAWAATSTSGPASGKPGVTSDPSVQDRSDGTPPPPAGTAPAVMAAWWRPTWATSGGAAPLFLRDFRRPLAESDNRIQTWEDLILYATDGYQGDTISLFVSGAGMPNTIGGKDVAYKLVLTYGPAAYMNDAGTQKEWVLPAAPQGTGMLQWATITLPAAGAIGSTPIQGSGELTATQTVGYRFSFVTPEPGSMIVLASGLAGLVGLVARRRA